ncbi:Protein CBG24995 [Caenorhabditis briggsae]|uniref:Protein CBG00639 n=1 Tax=Caenorhabditis briggsae TaxID=6238 RepID=G2J6A2_CAEBR|nr:Protein CBG00639 [Caenorhabditis briggsae]XP_002648646.1 Protein CBG24995 [Caenorhabditis briggsae]CAP21474.1 Protein CBG24995 [Caenorhabditis briggsae]CAP21997.1 Protein CBG00639 [Caenorhabditis briggsae]
MAEKEGEEDYWSKLPWELKEEIVGYLPFFYKDYGSFFCIRLTFLRFTKQK